ncbi:MAG: hypothetical protein WBM76_13805 [Woeseiaceae bacterium]|jgi:hypothetical protein
MTKPGTAAIVAFTMKMTIDMNGILRSTIVTFVFSVIFHVVLL